MAQIIGAGLTAVLHLVLAAVVLGPLIWWQARRAGHPALAPGGVRRLAAMAGLYVGTTCVLNLPRVGFFADLDWNWQNKLLIAALLALAITMWPGLSWRQVGARLPRRGWWIPVLGISAVMLGLGLLEPQMPTADIEAALFQAIVPGLDEELLYRGVLLLVLARALVTRRAMWRGEAGWEVPITCLLFGLAHGVFLTADPGVEVDLVAIVSTGLLGLLLVWIRIRWNSLWPVILAHNGINSAAVLATAIAQS